MILNLFWRSKFVNLTLGFHYFPHINYVDKKLSQSYDEVVHPHKSSFILISTCILFIEKAYTNIRFS